MMRQRLLAIAICGLLALAGLSALTFAQGTFPGLLGANQILGSIAGGTPGALSINGGSSCTNALIYTNGVGFGCNTTAGTGTVTGVTPSTGLSPNSTITGTGTFFVEAISPGGRLTLASNTPVMASSQTGAQTLYYTSYINRMVPIYNGTNTQLYPLCAASTTGACEISLALAASANWPANSAFDVFAYNNAGTPALCTVAWTNTTTRATALAKFSGISTNATLATCRTGAASTISLAANQGAYLGSVCTDAATAGQISWTLGGSASGGSAARLCVFNNYNRRAVGTNVIDNGVSYTYSSATIRQARASAGNQVQLLLGALEDGIRVSYSQVWFPAAASAAQVQFGIGIDSTTTFFDIATQQQPGVTTRPLMFASPTWTITPADISIGLHTISANEKSDGSNANGINQATNGTLSISGLSM